MATSTEITTFMPTAITSALMDNSSSLGTMRSNDSTTTHLMETSFPMHMTTSSSHFTTEMFQNFTTGPIKTMHACSKGMRSSPKDVGLTNEYVFENFYLPALVLTCLMFIIGLPGNSLVIYVYWRKWRKTTSRIFILALAIFDVVNCLLMPYEAVNVRNVIQFDYDASCKFTRMITFMMNNASSFTLVAIAIDRYMRICRPLKAPLTNRKAKLAVLISLVIAVVFSIPAAILYGSMSYLIPLGKFPGYCALGKLCLISDTFIKTSWPLYFGIFTLVGHLTIDLILIFCYVLIGVQVLKRGDFDDHCKLKRNNSNFSSHTTDNEVLESDVYKKPPIVKQNSFQSSISKAPMSADDESLTPVAEQIPMKNSSSDQATKSHKKGGLSAAAKRSFYQKKRSLSVSSMTSRKGRAYKTTLMLLCVTLLFIISFFPYTIIVIKRYTDDTYYDRLSNSGKAVYQLFLRFYLMSSALNPVIYSFLSDQFRQECRNVFKRLTCR